MKKFIIFNSEIYSFEKSIMQKGGVLTYIKDLAKLGQEMGAQTIMYQYEDKNLSEREYDWNGILIREVYATKTLFKSLPQAAFDKIYEKENCEDTIFVISTDQLDVRSKAQNVIQIQHGVAFDIPGTLICSSLYRGCRGQMINKLFRCVHNVNRLNNIPTTVCVDYNYYNWFRTIGTESDEHRMHVIPNYTSDCISREILEKKLSSRGDVKKIVFARRMVEHRGSLLFARVAKRLLDERKDVNFTFSGDGPCLKQMHELLDGYTNVRFTEYLSEDCISFHKEFDICVVPTIYSEGTSLSLIEGMASGCIPVSTHVGGLTNIILDGYNGFLVHPDEDSFYKKIEEVLNLSKADFNTVAKNAYDSAVKAFFVDKWKKDWKKVLEQKFNKR